MVTGPSRVSLTDLWISFLRLCGTSATCSAREEQVQGVIDGRPRLGSPGIHGFGPSRCCYHPVCSRSPRTSLDIQARKGICRGTSCAGLPTRLQGLGPLHSTFIKGAAGNFKVRNALIVCCNGGGHTSHSYRQRS